MQLLHDVRTSATNSLALPILVFIRPREISDSFMSSSKRERVFLRRLMYAGLPFFGRKKKTLFFTGGFHKKER